jgi:ABC-type amino acid transport substrate-binding protein
MRILSVAVAVCVAGSSACAGTLDDVRSSGIVRCGVDNEVEGFSAKHATAEWTGLPVVFCQALALAVIGDKTKVNFTMLTPAERVEALQSGEVDVLVSALPVSMQVESRDGLLFTGPLFSDASATYAAAVRQGDDQWFVMVRWLRNLMLDLPQPQINSCAAFDAIADLRKNWACDVLLEFGGVQWSLVSR